MHASFVKDPQPPEAVWSCRCEHDPRRREECSEVNVVLVGQRDGHPEDAKLPLSLRVSGISNGVVD